MKIGIGMDAHRFAPGRRLVLGGVEIPGHAGLAGHSDADVVLHALMDALLGACGADDIGERFPDTDPAFSGASSLTLLEDVCGLVRSQGRRVVNVDMVVVCEEPKISGYRQAMRASVARACGMEPGRVSIKGTTTEGMGFTGRGEGIAAIAVALLSEPAEAGDGGSA